MGVFNREGRSTPLNFSKCSKTFDLKDNLPRSFVDVDAKSMVCRSCRNRRRSIIFFPNAGIFVAGEKFNWNEVATAIYMYLLNRDLLNRDAEPEETEIEKKASGKPSRQR